MILECWNWAKDEPCQVWFWLLCMATVKTFMCRHLCMMAACTINIYKMAAIFQFFHNGQHWYSISVDTQKTGDSNFGGSVIWNFSVQLIFMKWWPFFDFFHNGQHWYSWTFTGDELSALKSMWWLMQIFCWFSFPCHDRFSSNIYAWLQLKHLCMMTFLYLKVPRKICQNRLRHLCIAVVNHLGDSDESPIKDNSTSMHTTKSQTKGIQHKSMGRSVSYPEISDANFKWTLWTFKQQLALKMLVCCGISVVLL